MLDLAQQVRTYFDETLAEISPEEVRYGGGTPEVEAHLSTLAWVAIAAAVAAAVLLPVLFLTDNDAPDVATTVPDVTTVPVSTTISVTSSTEPSPSTSVVEGGVFPDGDSEIAFWVLRQLAGHEEWTTASISESSLGAFLSLSGSIASEVDESGFTNDDGDIRFSIPRIGFTSSFEEAVAEVDSLRSAAPQSILGEIDYGGVPDPVVTDIPGRSTGFALWVVVLCESEASSISWFRPPPCTPRRQVTGVVPVGFRGPDGSERGAVVVMGFSQREPFGDLDVQLDELGRLTGLVGGWIEDSDPAWTFPDFGESPAGPYEFQYDLDPGEGPRTESHTVVASVMGDLNACIAGGVWHPDRGLELEDPSLAPYGFSGDQFWIHDGVVDIFPEGTYGDVESEAQDQRIIVPPLDLDPDDPRLTVIAPLCDQPEPTVAGFGLQSLLDDVDGVRGYENGRDFVRYRLDGAAASNLEIVSRWAPFVAVEAEFLVEVTTSRVWEARVIVRGGAEPAEWILFDQGEGEFLVEISWHFLLDGDPVTGPWDVPTF